MSYKAGVRTLMIFSLLFAIFPQTYGQVTNPPINPPRAATVPSFPPVQGRTNLPPRQATLTAEQKKFVAGSVEDHAKYADFLKHSDTGMFRLLPRVDYQTALTVDAQTPERTLPIRGGGAYYSFGQKSHFFGPWSDICLQDNVLFTQVANLSIGLFTAIGDVPLESVTLQSPGVDFLTRMPVPTIVSEAALQVKRNDKGFQEGEFTYRSMVRVFPNLTYILRSVVYRRPDFIMALPGSNIVLSSANVYQGADLIIAFRIVRQEEDGIVTVLWKRLKKTSAPQIKREKSNPATADKKKS
jgi:hypothetical protein